MIGSEAVPFAKSGGLADVLGALPPALARLGWDVTLALPKYRSMAEGARREAFSLHIGARSFDVRLQEAALGEGAQALFVDVPELYDRDELYHVNGVDYPDNPIRFAVLVRAALEAFARRRLRPTVVHAHDWQAALAPVYLRGRYAHDPVLGGVPSVLTIHNLAFQGNFDPAWMTQLDLPSELFSPARLEFWGRMSFLKGGIIDADMITTVSPHYANEIQTHEFGCGFDGILRDRRASLVGILNGIDTAMWNPSGDAFLPEPFSGRSLAGKRAAKAAVLARLRLARDAAALKRPLVGMISRMVDQKGLDLIAALADRLPELGAGFVVLGSGESRYERLWLDLTARYPDRVGVKIGFDEALAHLIEGGADVFLMPSRFEPCGLNQMYSLRYGTVPIVRAVGGLIDTVRDGVNGFVFQEYTPTALLGALQRALAAFGDKREWRALQVTGMREDHSWDRSAREYVKIYERLSGTGLGTRDSQTKRPLGGPSIEAKPSGRRPRRHSSRGRPRER
jgi:starch synthase